MPQKVRVYVLGSVKWAAQGHFMKVNFHTLHGKLIWLCPEVLYLTFGLSWLQGQRQAF